MQVRSFSSSFSLMARFTSASGSSLITLRVTQRHHAERDEYGGILKCFPAMNLRRFPGTFPERAGRGRTIPKNNSGKFSRDLAFRKLLRGNDLRQARPADARGGSKKHRCVVLT
jgi:hypothetical protein